MWSKNDVKIRMKKNDPVKETPTATNRILGENQLKLFKSPLPLPCATSFSKKKKSTNKIDDKNRIENEHCKNKYVWNAKSRKKINYIFYS